VDRLLAYGLMSFQTFHNSIAIKLKDH